MVDENQCSYNGLTMGKGTIYGITSIRGLSEPNPTAEIVKKPGAPGAWTYATPAVVPERHIIVQGLCNSPDAWAAMKDEWEPAFLTASDHPFEFDLMGSGPQIIQCKPLIHDFDIDLMAANRGFIRWLFELVAGDPTINPGSPS
jgi:hypothetical protein